MSNKRNKSYECPDMADMITRVARGLVRRAAEGDLEALTALANSERVMHEALTAAIQQAHSEPNAYSWSEIGTELGMTKQAVAQRAAQPTSVTPTRPRKAA